MAAKLADQTAPPPPGWVRPEALTSSAGLDPDVAAGLEFLAGLDKRLHDLAVRMHMLERRILVIERLQLQHAERITQGFTSLAERLAALEALLRGR